MASKVRRDPRLFNQSTDLLDAILCLIPSANSKNLPSRKKKKLLPFCKPFVDRAEEADNSNWIRKEYCLEKD